MRAKKSDFLIQWRMLMEPKWPSKESCPYHNIDTSKVNCGTCRDARSMNRKHEQFMEIINSQAEEGKVNEKL